MILRRLYQEQLAQASYLVGCSVTSEALIVDPNRNVDQYIDLAMQEGLRITAIAETHIHADFVSGARELAQRTGATLYLSDAGPAAWKYAFADDAGATLLRDGDSFHVGSVRIDVMHTPGHTPEHLSLLVTDTPSANEPMGIFTGDFVFVGDVGRPDLLEKAAGVAGSTAQAAQQLFHSIQRVRDFPDYLQIWPGHGAGSACGRALGAVPQSTVGYERRYNWAFGAMDASQFMAAVLEGQPEAPRYFGQMKRVNKEGAQPVASLPDIEERPVEQFPMELDAGLLVVDTRPAEQYASGHVPGTLNIPLGGAFLTWAGALLPYDRPFALIAEPGSAQAAMRQLRLIGLDNLAGYWTSGALDAWTANGRTLAQIERIEPQRLAQRIERGEVVVVDVRRPEEHAAGHIAGSVNIPLTQLRGRLDEVPGDRPVLVHCQGGTRSPIAASVLSARRPGAVIDLLGGLVNWQAAGNPIEHGVRTTMPEAA